MMNKSFIRNKPERKNQTKVEKQKAKRRKVLKIGQFESKNMFILFFRTSAVVNISHLDMGKTKDYQTYIKVRLKPHVST
jgi:hypothetical protein